VNYRRLAVGAIAVVGAGLLTFCMGPTSRADAPSGASAEALLAAVRAGCEAARSEVSTRVGTITIRESSWEGDRERLVTETTYQVVTDGAREKVSEAITYLVNDAVPPDPTLAVNVAGTTTTKQVASDGERFTVYRPGAKSAIVCGLDSALASDARSIRQTIEEVSPGVPDLNRAPASPRYVRRGPVIVGREEVRGEDCVVVEVCDVRVDANGDEISSYQRFWIAPQQGFVALKAEAGSRGGRYGEGVVFAQTEAEATQYPDGTWGLGRLRAQQYSLEGPPNLETQIVVTMADDYRLNAPVTEEMLKVQLPSGTKVYNELIEAEYTVP
jgi:hypothetical protein